MTRRRKEEDVLVDNFLNGTFENTPDAYFTTVQIFI